MRWSRAFDRWDFVCDGDRNGALYARHVYSHVFGGYRTRYLAIAICPYLVRTQVFGLNNRNIAKLFIEVLVTAK
jgi:hypothetical protein